MKLSFSCIVAWVLVQLSPDAQANMASARDHLGLSLEDFYGLNEDQKLHLVNLIRFKKTGEHWDPEGVAELEKHYPVFDGHPPDDHPHPHAFRKHHEL